MIHKINPSQAWLPGATFWLVIDEPSNSWFAQLDWKLNFMLSQKKDHSLITVPTQKMLPTDWVVSIKTWENIHLCNLFNFPYEQVTVRVFGLKEEQLLHALENKYQVEWVLPSQND